MEKQIRNYLFKSSFVLLLVVFILTGFLNISSFHQKYTNSLLSTYIIYSHSFINKIESAVKYGKSINNFYGMNDSLEKWINDDGDIIGARILSKNSDVLYEFYKSKKEDLSFELIRSNDFNNKDMFKTKFYLNNYHVFLPIRNIDNQWIATFEFYVPKSTIEKYLDVHTSKLITYLLFLLFSSIIFIYFYSFKGNFFTKDYTIKK